MIGLPGAPMRRGLAGHIKDGAGAPYAARAMAAERGRTYGGSPLLCALKSSPFAERATGGSGGRLFMAEVALKEMESPRC